MGPWYDTTDYQWDKMILIRWVCCFNEAAVFCHGSLTDCKISFRPMSNFNEAVGPGSQAPGFNETAACCGGSPARARLCESGHHV